MGRFRSPRTGRVLAMSVLIKGGRIITAADDYVGDIYIEGERITTIGESLDVSRGPHDRRERQVRPARRGRPAHASRDAVARQDDGRRLLPRARRGGLRRHDDARRLLHPGQGADVRRGPRDLARQARGQGDHRQRLPHHRHRPERERRDAGGARDAARRARRQLVQALHGLQRLAADQRRGALQGDAGRRQDRRAA